MVAGSFSGWAGGKLPNARSNSSLVRSRPPSAARAAVAVCFGDRGEPAVVGGFNVVATAEGAGELCELATYHGYEAALRFGGHDRIAREASSEAGVVGARAG